MDKICFEPLEARAPCPKCRLNYVHDAHGGLFRLRQAKGLWMDFSTHTWELAHAHARLYCNSIDHRAAPKPVRAGRGRRLGR